MAKIQRLNTTIHKKQTTTKKKNKKKAKKKVNRRQTLADLGLACPETGRVYDLDDIPGHR